MQRSSNAVIERFCTNICREMLESQGNTDVATETIAFRDYEPTLRQTSELSRDATVVRTAEMPTHRS